VNHHVGVVLNVPRLLLGWLVAIRSILLAIIHLHVVLATLLLILVLALGILDVNVLATIRVAILLFRSRACSLLTTSHRGIFSLYSGALGLFLLFFLLFDSVLVAVSVQVSLGLLRRELGRGRLLRIPRLVSHAHDADSEQAYEPLDSKACNTRLLS
jgi:hypothetical protein